MSSTPNHSDRDHAVLSPSGAHRWMLCPGSVKAEEGIPDKGSPFAAEGTAAHELGERCLRQGIEPKDLIGEQIDDFTVDHEMAEAVGVYVSHVNSIPGARLIEERVSLARWIPDSFGTADAIVIDEDHLHVIDLKYGKGVQVEAENNPQGIAYALGAYDLVSDWSEIKQVSIHISQPRVRRMPSVWSLSVDDLLGWGKKIRAAAKRITDGDTTRNPSDSVCKWCKGKATCKALANAAMATARVGFEDLNAGTAAEQLSDTDDMSWDEIAIVLDNIDMLSNWANAVKDHAYRSALEGVEVPNYKLVAGRAGARSWAVDQKEFFRHAMGLGYEEETLVTKKPITPTQLQKVVGKDKFSDEFEDLVTRPEPKPALVAESDKRPALVIDRAAGFE